MVSFSNIPPLTKKSILESQFMYYGFLPFVYLIREFEQEERYEDCKLIVEIIKDKSEKFDVHLPTKYDKESIDLFFTEFQNSKNKGEIAFKNIPFYADKIRCSIAGFNEIKERARSFVDSFFNPDDYEFNCHLCDRRNCKNNSTCIGCGHSFS